MWHVSHFLTMRDHVFLSITCRDLYSITPVLSPYERSIPKMLCRCRRSFVTLENKKYCSYCRYSPIIPLVPLNNHIILNDQEVYRYASNRFPFSNKKFGIFQFIRMETRKFTISLIERFLPGVMQLEFKNNLDEMSLLFDKFEKANACPFQVVSARRTKFTKLMKAFDRAQKQPSDMNIRFFKGLLNSFLGPE